MILPAGCCRSRPLSYTHAGNNDFSLCNFLKACILSMNLLSKMNGINWRKPKDSTVLILFAVKSRKKNRNHLITCPLFPLSSFLLEEHESLSSIKQSRFSNGSQNKQELLRLKTEIGEISAGRHFPFALGIMKISLNKFDSLSLVSFVRSNRI